MVNRINKLPGDLVGDGAKSQLLSIGGELLGLSEEAASPEQLSITTRKSVRLQADAARSILDEPNTPLLADGQPQSSIEEQSILLNNILHTVQLLVNSLLFLLGNYWVHRDSCLLPEKWIEFMVFMQNNWGSQRCYP